MTAPIPRPPGLWRAIARDHVLNPEEAATRATVLADLTQPTEPPPAQPTPPQEDVDEQPPRLRLSPYQSLIDRSGWKPFLTHTEDRARLEGFQPDGAAVIAIAVRGEKTKAYVLPAAPKRQPRWRAIAPADLGEFLTGRRVIAPRPPASNCSCEKRRYPTEARAKAAIVDVTIRRVVKLRGLQSERRAYRCPDDDLTWHLTHIAKWYDDKNSKHREKTS
ncbi:hypothetical protein [Streptomyces cylindrosporus]|uniref:Uncharacterized protein n=1 Tax=Streptomyces cylindrosporus TaxID=2927583 RepID=A0ABS9YJY2_9ACTN|nr:hypothetical protein [Streptomyces cylindrosporus]MCI3277504.1 hypothetical protein [Streptomyces cylindrosporus]